MHAEFLSCPQTAIPRWLDVLTEAASVNALMCKIKVHRVDMVSEY